MSLPVLTGLPTDITLRDEEASDRSFCEALHRETSERAFSALGMPEALLAM